MSRTTEPDKTDQASEWQNQARQRLEGAEGGKVIVRDMV